MVDSDSDHDGIPDWWEWQFAGNLAAFSSGSDYDGDGLSDAQEHSLGTNPTDPFTRGLLFAPVRLADGAFQCDFVGETNRQYRVLMSTNMTNWDVLGRVVGWRDRFIDPVAGEHPRRFYRTDLTH